MTRRNGLLTAAVVASALALGACSSNSPGSASGTRSTESIQELNVGSTAISTLNYNKNNVGYGNGLGNLIMEPLLVQDPHGTLKPWLAKSWEQPNPRTYVYHLRQGVKFSDGNELTAEDVAFSYNYYRRAGSANAYNFPSTLKSVTAPDKYTVKVTLSKAERRMGVGSGAAIGRGLREELLHSPQVVIRTARYGCCGHRTVGARQARPDNWC